MGSAKLSAAVGLFKPRPVVAGGTALLPRAAGGHGKSVALLHSPPRRVLEDPRVCSLLALPGMFYLMFTRSLDKENVPTSSGAPCPLEETKVVPKGKVY